MSLVEAMVLTSSANRFSSEPKRIALIAPAVGNASMSSMYVDLMGTPGFSIPLPDAGCRMQDAGCRMARRADALRALERHP